MSKFQTARKLRKALVITFSCLALLAVIFGVYGAVHSPLFLVQVVEVADQSDQGPVDAHTITQLAAVPLGMLNLFDLDLKLVEKRILTHSWIREVRLQKRFPQTLSISVAYRQPRALVQTESGNLSYVDQDGKAFGQLSLGFHPDLPVFSGFTGEAGTRIEQGIRLLDLWEKSPVGPLGQVSSVSWDASRGYRILVTYPLKGSSTHLGRSMVDLGQEIDAQTGDQLERLSHVVKYLSQNRIAVHQIWADAGKKIVVKTAHGS